MNLRLRWALAILALALYWAIPASLYFLWTPYLLGFVLLFGLRHLGNTLLTLFILSVLLIPIQLYQATQLDFLKSWLCPLIPLTFLFPATACSLEHRAHRHPMVGYRHWLRLTGSTTFIGNGAFQIVHGLSVFLFASPSKSFNRVLTSPAFFIPILWLLTGILLKLLQLGGLSHLSTAASWLWAPALCLSFAAFSPEQLRNYLQGIGSGLALSSAFGLVIYIFNPSLEAPILNFLPSISSLHQAKIPGSENTWAASGFFFHRLKFAHLSLLLLPTILFIPSRVIKLLSAVLAVVALVLSHATWAIVVAVALLPLCIVLRLRKLPKAEFVIGAALLCTLAVHGLIVGQPNLSEKLIAKSPSLQTRQFMATQAIEHIEERPYGMGHGSYKAWSIEHYPSEFNNRQLPRTLPHNLGLSTLVETGIAGWSLLVALLTYLLSQSVEVLWKARASAQAKRLAFLIGSATLTFLGLGMLHDPLYHKPVAFGWMVIIGLGHRLRTDHSI